MKQGLALALLLAVPSLAGTPFLSQLEERSARFSALQNVILMDIQESDNNQLEAYQIYAKDVSKEMILFGQLLQKSYDLIDSMRTNPSQKQLDEFKNIISEMDSSIVRLKLHRSKVDAKDCD